MSLPVTAQELGAFLLASKVCKSAPDGLETFIRLAVQKAEDLSGWRPYFSSGQAEGRRFDPPEDGRLSLRGGVLSISSVVIGYTDDDAGTELEENTGYTVEPGDAWSRGEPVTHIRLYGSTLGLVSGAGRSVVVTGVWGKVLPATEAYQAAKDALLLGAAAEAFEFASESPGEVASLKQGPVTVEYQKTGEGSGRKGTWSKAFESFFSSRPRIAF